MKYQLTLAVAPLLWHATVAEIVLIGVRAWASFRAHL